MGWSDAFNSFADDVLGGFGIGSGNGSEGPLGTFWWKKEFNQFLTSYNDVLAQEGNWLLDPGYSFKVCSINSASPHSSFGEFRLPLNPSSLQQEEEFAISFKPTQTGIIVEHSGAIFKDIVLSGTCGLLPKGARARTDELLVQSGGLSNTIGQISSLATPAGLFGTLTESISAFGSEHTGYTWTHLLANYLRAYSQAKTTNAGKELILVFCNKKDVEEWQCEVTSISINRQAGRGFLYDYRITLKAMRRNVPTQTDTLGFFNDVLDIVTSAENIIDSSVALLNGASNFLASNINLIKQVESSIISTVLSPINEVISALNGVKTTGSKFPTAQKKVLSEIKDKVRQISDNWADLTGQGDTTYNSTLRRDPSYTPTANRAPSYQEIKVSESLQDMSRGLDYLLATNLIYNSDSLDPTITSITTNQKLVSNTNLNSLKKRSLRAASKSKIEQYFNNSIQLKNYPSVSSIVVQRGDTLEDIAVRTTGNVINWIEIALMNDMEWPYIDDTVALTNSKVKKTGDEIFVPSLTAQNYKVLQTKENYLTQGLTPAEKYMGVDLKLSVNNDFIVTNSSDLAFSYGVNNASQALKINLSLERGELKYHPNKGVGLVVGEKSTNSLPDMANAVRQSILTDDRFDSITGLSLQREGSAYKLVMSVKIANVMMPVPLIIKI